MRTGGLPCFILLVASDLVEIRRRGKTSSPSPRSPWRTLGVASTRAAVVVARAKSTPTASRHGGGWPICAILARPHGLIYIGGAAPSHLSNAPPWRDPPPRAASRAGSPLLRLLGIGPSRRLRPPSALSFLADRLLQDPPPPSGGRRCGHPPQSHHLPGGIRTTSAWAHRYSTYLPSVSLSHLRASVEEEREGLTGLLLLRARKDSYTNCCCMYLF